MRHNLAQTAAISPLLSLRDNRSSGLVTRMDESEAGLSRAAAEAPSPTQVTVTVAGHVIVESYLFPRYSAKTEDSPLTIDGYGAGG
jgi:hypothetical protein